MKKCPICKKEHETKWKYCSNECVDKAIKLSEKVSMLTKQKRANFLDELTLEMLPPKQYRTERKKVATTSIILDEEGRRVV